MDASTDTGIGQTDVKELSQQLMARINAHRRELPASPMLMAQKWLDRQELTGRERRVCQGVLARTFDRPAAGIPRVQIVEAMGLRVGGMASNQEADRTTAALLRRGILYRIRGNKKRAHVWWGGWLQEVVGVVDDNEAWDLLADLMRQATPERAENNATDCPSINATDGGRDNATEGTPVNATATNAAHYKAHLQSSLVKARVAPPAQRDPLPLITDMVETAAGAWQAPPAVAAPACRWCYGRGCSECPDRVAARFEPLDVGRKAQ